MSTAHRNWLTRVAAAIAVAAAVWPAGCASTSAPKKPAPPQYAVPRTLGSQPQKEESKSSWLGSWFEPAEPEKPANVPSWMAGTKRVDP